MTTTSPKGFPELLEDIFSDDNLKDSNPLYKRVRDLGDAVWVPSIKQFVVARYADVAKCLKADEILISGKGVSVNEAQNKIFSDQAEITQASTLTTDGKKHSHFKRFVMRPLLPKNLSNLKENIQTMADELIDELAHGGTIEGVTQLASYMPLQIIAKMVGIKVVDNEKMLGWAEAIFNSFGPDFNQRSQAAFPKIIEFVDFYSQISRDTMVPGGWADQLMSAVDSGELSYAEAHSLTSDYVIPSLDTTIHSTAELMLQLANNPEAFEQLKNDESLVPSAVLEAVRMATPLRGFTRYVTDDFELSDSTLPAGSRVWLWYASANRDERHYTQPDHFDLTRRPTDNLGWGHGVHSCVGKHLAQIEIESILRAVLKRVDKIEVGKIERMINNSAQGFKLMELKLFPSH
jgi:cytochrome P450